MALIAAQYPTLIDMAKLLDPDGKAATVAEILSQTNEALMDIPFIMANDRFSHRTTLRTSLPQATWRLLYGGVPYSKSTTAQITDSMGMLESFSFVDKAMADAATDLGLFRLSEDKPFIEGMNQTMAQTLIYGNIASNPAAFTGLAPRYNTVSVGTSEIANNVIDGGGTGSDNTSIWLVIWDESTVHGIFPKGSKAGLSQNDVTTTAPVDAPDGSGKMLAYQTHYKWDMGVSVRDWRYIVRICNIDVSDLAGGSPINIQRLMIRAMNKIPNLNAGRAAFYCNRTVKTWADIQATEKTTLAFQTVEGAQGKPVTQFRSIPMRTLDQILNTEARVV
jgi:hypothetical protein